MRIIGKNRAAGILSLRTNGKRQAKAERIGTNVFIGHGRSKEWKDLKDFISGRMRLPWDEFNRLQLQEFLTQCGFPRCLMTLHCISSYDSGGGKGRRENAGTYERSP